MAPVVREGRGAVQGWRRVYLVTPSGEILLKSDATRRRMLRLLVDAIRDALERRGLSLSGVRIDGARLLLGSPSPPRDVLHAVSRVFGVQYVASTLATTFGSLEELASKVAEGFSELVKGRRFAVRVHRYGRHDFTSLDVARVVGAALKPYSAGVDLEEPEVEVYVEVRGSTAYVYTGGDKVKGPGGLPPGSEGSCLALFSGGLDSPVAAWFTARRGVRVDLLHAVVSSPASLYYALRVGRLLAREWLHGYKPRMIVIDVASMLSSLLLRLPKRLWMLAFKKILYQQADMVATGRGYDSLATGESLGQTSSQTLHNLAVLHRAASTRLPVLRPLLGLDKLDIEEHARSIGVYEEASKTPEYSALVRRGATPRAGPRDEEELRRLQVPPPRVLVEVDLLEDDWRTVLEKLPLELCYVPPDAQVYSVASLPKLPPVEELDPDQFAGKPTPVLVVTPKSEEEQARRLVEELRRRHVHAYMMAVEKPSPEAIEQLRIRIEPGEQL